MYGFGDYDRWKCDPGWGVREERCEHCGGVKHECDPMGCVRCGTEACTGSLVCEECDEWECASCNERCNAAEQAACERREGEL